MKSTEKPQINARLEPELWDKIHRLSFETGWSKTKIINFALSYYVNQLKDKGAK